MASGHDLGRSPKKHEKNPPASLSTLVRRERTRPSFVGYRFVLAMRRSSLNHSVLRK